MFCCSGDVTVFVFLCCSLGCLVFILFVLILMLFLIFWRINFGSHLFGLQTDRKRGIIMYK